jgi:hypothetical protein
MTRRYVPRRRRYRRAPAPPSAVERTTAHEEVVEERSGTPLAADPFDPGPRPEVAPWARSVWFWLLLLGVASVIVVALVLATQSR